MAGEQGAPPDPLSYISLFSDFGDVDGYVGAMKGVILGIHPTATMIDVAHHSPPGDVLAGAFSWATALELFPGGGVHLGVVDPGVGTDRRAVAVEVGNSRFVAPDNGLISAFIGAAAKSVGPARPTGSSATTANSIPHGDFEVQSGLDQTPRPFRRWLSQPMRAVAIAEEVLSRPVASSTFHGRDIFAPAAARLLAGAPLTDLGTEIEPASLVRVAALFPSRLPSQARGVVAAVDRFGNLRTNLPAEWLETQPVLRIGTRSGSSAVIVRRSAGTFAAGSSEEPFIYSGSAGTLEVALAGESASEFLGIRSGAPVWLAAK